jgi:putative transposase
VLSSRFRPPNARSSSARVACCTAANRFPPEIISYAVWLYLRFSLSLRDVEELLADRGVAVTYETIGQWVRKFGPVFAQELRRRGRRPGDKLHLDEIALKVNGQRHWLWRAVDQHGLVVDILVQSRRAQHAAEAFIRRAVAGWGYTPRVVITDKLASYPPALRRVLPNSEYRRHKGLNNRAENSHLPTRQRERRMQRFKLAEQAQRFLEPFRLQPLPPATASADGNRLPRLMGEQRQTWREVTAVPAAR